MAEVRSKGDLAQRQHRNAKRGIKIRFLVLCAGLVLVFSGYSSMLLLQSSLNIVGGLGTKITAVSYASSILFSLLVVPLCIRVLGPKKSCIASEAAYILYVIANFYPVEWTLMIAGVVVGWAEATFWVPIGLLFIYYGKLYHPLSKKSEEVCVREFSGLLLGLNQLNQIVGNIFVFAILHFLSPPEETLHLQPNKSNTTTPPANHSFSTSPFLATTIPETNPFAKCGANDCQDQNTTMENIDQYVPQNKVALYALLSTFVVIMLTGMTIHICFMPDFPANGDIETEEADSEVAESDDKEKLQEEKETNSNKSKCSSQIFKETWMALKDIFKQVTDWRQLLIYPSNLYTALLVGFLFSEATRAYASCVMGVSQVGICSMVGAGTCCIASYVGGKCLGKYGVGRVTGFITSIDLAMHVTCILWTPTESTSWVIYLIFAWLGVAHGLWNLIITNVYAESFEDKRELCFTMWCCMYGIGFAMQFGWSTALCVRTKLLVQIPLLLLGTVCIVVLRRKTKQKPKI